MAEIRKLEKQEWLALIPVFDKVFDSDMPDFDHGEIYGIFEDGKCVSFILIEDVKMVGQVWSRNPKNNSNYVKSLLKFVREKIPAKQSVAAVASEPRFEMLFRTLGMQKIEGTLFRRNSK